MQKRRRTGRWRSPTHSFVRILSRHTDTNTIGHSAEKQTFETLLWEKTAGPNDTFYEMDCASRGSQFLCAGTTAASNTFLSFVDIWSGTQLVDSFSVTNALHILIIFETCWVAYGKLYSRSGTEESNTLVNSSEFCCEPRHVGGAVQFSRAGTAVASNTFLEGCR